MIDKKIISKEIMIMVVLKTIDKIIHILTKEIINKIDKQKVIKI